MYTPSIWVAMESTIGFSRESRELQNVLASGVFDRSPMLAQLLKYVCAKHFEGSFDPRRTPSFAFSSTGDRSV